MLARGPLRPSVASLPDLAPRIYGIAERVHCRFSALLGLGTMLGSSPIKPTLSSEKLEWG